jgi:CubicO group peptidase (beta-lactamase class C family)
MDLKRILLLNTLCLILFVSVASAQDSSSGQVDALFASITNTATPGCAVAVVQDGKTVHSKGYGMANLETGTPVRPDSIFHVASISKQFTAMAVLMLERDGKLSLDDNIRDYLPEVPDFGETITIRHLLQHTSGLRDQWDLLWLAGWREHDVVTEADILRLVSRQEALNFSPGDEFLYSNTGFTLAGTIVHRVSGKTLKEFTNERIFKQLGMNDTHFHDDHTHLVRNRTSAYQVGEGAKLSVSIPVFDNAGATSLFTTVEDFARWDQNFFDTTVGDAGVLEKLQEPSVLNNGEEQTYALGIAVGEYRGLQTVGHGGADAGYRADFVQFPEQHLSVMVFCNASNAGPSGISRSIADIYLADKLEPIADTKSAKTPSPATIALTEQQLSAFTGAYFHKQSFNFRRILVKDGKLVYHRGEGSESVLAHVADNRFIMLDVGAEVLVWFEQGGKDGFTMNVTVDGGKPLVHGPVQANEMTQDKLAAYAGVYHSSELDTDFRFYVEEGKLGLEIPKQESDLLIAVFEDSFVGTDGGYLTFSRNEKGEVAGMELTSGRVRNLAFSKR